MIKRSGNGGSKKRDIREKTGAGRPSTGTGNRTSVEINIEILAKSKGVTFTTIEETIFKLDLTRDTIKELLEDHFKGFNSNKAKVREYVREIMTQHG